MARPREKTASSSLCADTIRGSTTKRCSTTWRAAASTAPIQAGSLMLAKPSQEVAHGGGRRFAKDSDYYKTIFNWIAQGIPYGDPAKDTVVELRAEPNEIFMTKPGDVASLKVVARYQDDQLRDVTRETIIESNVPDVALVEPDKSIVSRASASAKRRCSCAIKASLARFR